MAEEMNTAPVESTGSDDSFDGGDSGYDGALDSTDDIVAALNEMDGVADEPAEPATDDTEVAEGEVQEPAEASAVPLPEGWDAAMWQSLTPEVQGRINQAVQDHAKALATEKKAQQDLMAKQHAYNMQVDAQLRNSLALVKSIVEAEYGGIDWATVAKEDPAAYVQLQQQYAQRMQTIKGMQQNITEKAAQIRQYNEQQAKAQLDNEYAQVLPEVQALVGSGFEGKQFANDMAQYLRSQGVPTEAINSIEKGYELKLAAKAMLYDRLMQARNSAAQKVADAPKVSAPTGAVQATGDGRMGKAMGRLRNNPNSTEALAAVLNLL